MSHSYVFSSTALHCIHMHTCTYSRQVAYTCIQCWDAFNDMLHTNQFTLRMHSEHVAYTCIQPHINCCIHYPLHSEVGTAGAATECTRMQHTCECDMSRIHLNRTGDECNRDECTRMQHHNITVCTWMYLNVNLALNASMWMHLNAILGKKLHVFG